MAFLDRCIFTAASSGTVNFVPASAVTGYQLPATAGSVDGYQYSYAAQSSDLSQWEYGHTVASSSGTSFTRVVLGNSLGTTAKINFTNPPQVMVTLLNEDIRTVLDSNITYSVTATGSDSTGNGTSAAPWATLQHAANVIASTIDIASFAITVSIGVGTFVGVDLPTFSGGGIVFFKGAGSGSTIIQDAASAGGCITNFNLQPATTIYFDKVKFNPVSAGQGILNGNLGFIFLGDTGGSTGDISFVAGGSGQVAIRSAFPGAQTQTVGTFALSGNWANVWELDSTGYANDGAVWTLSGTPAFSDAFISCTDISTFILASTYTGAATGKRFNVAGNALIDTGGSGPTAFPGNSAGTLSDGGIYR